MRITVFKSLVAPLVCDPSSSVLLHRRFCFELLTQGDGFMSGGNLAWAIFNSTNKAFVFGAHRRFGGIM
jgi:hypothetical protein